MIIVFNQDGTFNLTCDNLNSIKPFIESSNSLYIETNENLDFANYSYSLVDGNLIQIEITDRPVLD